MGKKKMVLIFNKLMGVANNSNILDEQRNEELAVMFQRMMKEKKHVREISYSKLDCKEGTLRRSNVKMVTKPNAPAANHSGTAANGNLITAHQGQKWKIFHTWNLVLRYHSNRPRIGLNILINVSNNNH